MATTAAIATATAIAAAAAASSGRSMMLSFLTLPLLWQLVSRPLSTFRYPAYTDVSYAPSPLVRACSPPHIASRC